MSDRSHHLNREYLNRLRARSERLRLVATLAFSMSLLIFCSLSFLFLIPLLNEKKQLTQQLEQLEREEKKHKDKLEFLKIELRALKNDPAYIELAARDIGSWALPNETLLEIKR